MMSGGILILGGSSSLLSEATLINWTQKSNNPFITEGKDKKKVQVKVSKLDGVGPVDNRPSTN